LKKLASSIALVAILSSGIPVAAQPPGTESPGPSPLGEEFVRCVTFTGTIPEDVTELLGALVQGSVEIVAIDDPEACVGGEEPPLTPDEGVRQVAVGDSVEVETFNGVIQVTVDEYHFARAYRSQLGAQRPDRGRLYYAFHVSYESVEGSPSFNQFDWQAFAGAEILDTTFVVGDGPGDSLGSGSLPQGRTASGWLLFDGPDEPGIDVTLSYKAGMLDEPIFEVKVECCRPIRGRR
jgi:hypothetical protein